jgi:hypothetical protein
MLERAPCQTTPGGQPQGAASCHRRSGLTPPHAQTSRSKRCLALPPRRHRNSRRRMARLGRRARPMAAARLETRHGALRRRARHHRRIPWPPADWPSRSATGTPCSPAGSRAPPSGYGTWQPPPARWAGGKVTRKTWTGTKSATTGHRAPGSHDPRHSLPDSPIVAPRREPSRQESQDLQHSPPAAQHCRLCALRCGW